MSEIRLVAVVRDVDATGEAWIRPVASVDWHEAFAFGVTEEEAQVAADALEESALHSAEDRDGKMMSYRPDCPSCRADRKLRAAFNEPVPEDSPDA